MEKDLLNSSLEDFYIPRPKSIVLKPISPTPANTPISECTYMLDSFKRVCNCKDFASKKIQDECHEVFNEIRKTCFENKN